MRVVIERIEDAGPDRRARRLVFAGGDVEPRLTAASVVRALALEEGQAFDLDELGASLEEAEASCARERALRVLGYRERSVRELTRRLLDDGFPVATVTSVVARLSELSLVDDERFATQWVRARAAARFGPDRIRRELRHKGVAEETIARVMDLSDDEAVLAGARAVVGGEVPQTRRQRERLLARLLRKGYDRQTALRALSGAHDDEMGLDGED